MVPSEAARSHTFCEGPGLGCRVNFESEAVWLLAELEGAAQRPFPRRP